MIVKKDNITRLLRDSGVFIVNFEQILHIFLEFPVLTLIK